MPKLQGFIHRQVRTALYSIINSTSGPGSSVAFVCMVTPKDFVHRLKSVQRSKHYHRKIFFNSFKLIITLQDHVLCLNNLVQTMENYFSQAFILGVSQELPCIVQLQLGDQSRLPFCSALRGRQQSQTAGCFFNSVGPKFVTMFNLSIVGLEPSCRGTMFRSQPSPWSNTGSDHY